MTADELNRRLAEALGWVLCEHIQQWRPWYGARDCDFIPVRDFSPATSVDDLRAYVLPEITKRGLSESFTSGLVTRIGWPIQGSHASWELDIMVLLETDSAVLAEAALEALEGGKG